VHGVPTFLFRYVVTIGYQCAIRMMLGALLVGVRSWYDYCGLAYKLI